MCVCVSTEIRVWVWETVNEWYVCESDWICSACIQLTICECKLLTDILEGGVGGYSMKCSRTLIPNVSVHETWVIYLLMAAAHPRREQRLGLNAW